MLNLPLVKTDADSVCTTTIHYTKKLIKKSQIGHHARPRRASATAPLRTGADTCKTGAGAGKRAGAKSAPVRRRSNHAWMEDQAGKREALHYYSYTYM